MTDAEAEQADLARIPGGLLINFGTIGALDGMLSAGRHANQNGKPIVFDPVGVGATAFRRASAASESFSMCRGKKKKGTCHADDP
jgi:thiamine-phosphate diphosphorylase / hydroxyethylthiazole kinase